MNIPEEQKKFVDRQLATIGYILANYRKFGDDALKVAYDFFYELGKSRAKSMKLEMGITENDANAVATILNAVLEKFAGIRGASRVDGYKVIIENKSFCPISEAAKIMDAPLDIICKNYVWRWYEGIAAGVNPNVMMEVPESRAWGKDCCLNILKVMR